MAKDVFTFLVGGKAGEGIKKTGSVAAHLFSSMGREVFLMDDYQSLIRGGHNFTVVSSSARPITSHHMKADVVVALNERSYERHLKDVAEGGILVYNSDSVSGVEGVGLPLTTEARKYPNPGLRLGVGALTALVVSMGLNRRTLEKLIKKEYRRDVENNIAYATAIYDAAREKIDARFKLGEAGTEKPIITGNQAIALGAVAGGLDVYFAYPMTPVSPILHYLAVHDRDFGVAVVQPENEIAAFNMAIGSTFVGAKAMVATSGGGFGLMQEAFSLAGMVESPVLCVLGSRSGPSTGMATYTEQGDLRFAIHQGHGEFARIVASPGSVEEAFYLTAEMLDMVWRFQTPGIMLTEKHLAESAMTVHIDANQAKWPGPVLHGEGEHELYPDTDADVSPRMFPPSMDLVKWNSDEHDQKGFTTEDPTMASKMHEKRVRKNNTIVEHMKKMKTVNVFGSRGPVIITYGSTTMSVLEALRTGDIEATVVQPIYLEPLPVWELDKYAGTGVIVVEQSCAGQFAALLEERVGIRPRASIRRYDGRPFEPSELAAKIKALQKGS